MGEIQEILDSVWFQITTFFVGIIAGTAVFGLEMVFFLGNTIMHAFSNNFPVFEASKSIISSYNSAIYTMIIVGFIQGIGIGMLAIEAFSFGYIIGVIIMVVLLVDSLWNVAPSVVVGMLMAIVAVLIGIVLKVLIKNKRKNNYRYY